MKAFCSARSSGLLFLAFGLVNAAWAQTEVGGTISVDTVWSDPVYHVTAHVYVSAGVTLTIEPGTVVKFDDDKILSINGTLDAQGSAGNLIFFTDIRDDTVGGDSNGDGNATAPALPAWAGIYVNSGASATLDHVEVRYGGRYRQYQIPGAVHKAGSGNLELSNSSIRHSDRSAVVLDGTDGVHVIANNLIDEVNQYYGIYLRDASGGVTIADNLISNVDDYGIYARGNTQASVTGNTIRDSRHTGLNLDAAAGFTMNLSGNLIEGNAYHGMSMRNATSALTIIGNTVRNNGQDGMYLADSSPLISDNSIYGHAARGIYMGGSSPDIFRNDIYGNDVGIYASASGNPLIGGSEPDANQIHGNAYGVHRASGGATILASCNWWGDASGPGGQGPGTGDAISAGVDAVPWNLEAGGQCYGGLPTRFVAVTGSDDGGANTCLDQQAPCATIAHAIGQADVGGTVQVAAGTYPEQVIINKRLRLEGQPGAVIQAPATPAAFELPEAPAGTSFEPVVIAFGGTESGGQISGSDTIEVDISGFTIDGQDRISASGSVRTAGILLRNVRGEASGNTIINMYQSLNPDPGRQTAGLLVYGDSTVDVIGNDVSGYSRSGIVIQGDDGPLPDPAGNVDGNIVTGPGAGQNPNWAPNGIQISYGASGSVTNNTISGHRHPDNQFAPGAVVVFNSENVTVEGNDLSDNRSSIQLQNASGTQITNNTVTISDYGMLIYPGSTDTLIDGNSLDDNDYGIVLYGTGADPVANITVSNNTVNGSGSAAVAIVGDSTAITGLDVSANQFGDNHDQLDADPGVLTEQAFSAANTFNLNIALTITPGVPGSVSIDSGWDHFTANLTSDGGIPENIVLWIEAAGIADADISGGLALELWDSGSSSWQRFGWGGASHWAIGRDAWFLGRDGSQIVGFPVFGGHDEDLYLRVNWPNGTYSATSSLESIDSGDGSGNPGDRIYLNQTDPVVIESTPSNLALSVTDGLPGGSPATIEDGWAHFSSTLSNSGGDVPENIVLWIEVAGIDDSHYASGFALEFWHDDSSSWQSYGWGGASSWQIGRDAWFMGRDGSQVSGFPIPAGFSDTQALRVNWPDGSYSATISVESLDSADGSGHPGDRIYLSQTHTLDVEQFVSPALAIAPASHDFGDVTMLDTATTSFTVSNTGSSTSSLELTGVSVSGDSQFAITGSGNCASGDVLAGGQSCTVEVSFAPGAVGAFSGSLDIASDAGSESAALSGQGIVPDWADSFDGAFDEPDWQFFAFDGTPALYPPATAGINGDYLQINDPAALYAGAYIPRSFGEARVAALVNADGTDSGDSPDNQIDQGVISHFNPDTLGSYTAYMRMELNYQDLVLAKVDASNFDPALIDERVRVADDTDGDWSMDRMYVVELDVVDQGGGEALLIARAFDADTGALLATVEATDTAPFGPGYAGLVAITNSTGVNGTFDTASAVSSFASASVSDDLIDFGQVAAHSTSTATTVTVTNNGNVDLNITGLTLSGTDATQFAIGNSDCADPVPAGNTCTFDVSFSPDGVGARSAEVQIESNASTSPDVVLLEGEGIPAQATVTLSDLVQTYDGSPKSATVTTSPAGLNVVVTYDGGSVLPVVVGSYSVSATVDEPDYEGSATGTLTIEKADQTISFPAIADKPADSGPFTISASSDSGLTVSFSVASGPATVNGNQITLVGASPGDTVTISADQAGNANWNPAPMVQQSFNITEGAAAEIQAVSSTSITGQAGQPVAAGDLPTVRVVDSQSNPVAGVTVSFAITSGGGTLAGATLSTNASGEARLGGWTLGGEATQTLEASAPGLSGNPVVFTASADADYQFAISVDDNRQSIEVGERNSYVIVVSNAGSSDAVGAQVTAQLPPELDAGTADWTCFAGGAASCGGPGTGDLADTANLPSGASVVYVLEADVIGGGTIEMEAQATLGGETATGSDSTDVLITEDAIFSDRFEAASSGNSIQLDAARQRLGAWLEVSGGVTGGLPPSVLLRGVDAQGRDVFRIRVLATDFGPLLRLSLRALDGGWQHSRWVRGSKAERLLAVDFDADRGHLLVTGKELEASLVTGRPAPGIVELVADKTVSIDSVD